MPGNDDISLHASRGSHVIVQEQHPPQEENALGANPTRQWESYGKRACVLAGSALLQLPIWGKASLSC